jgi:hypothetical protein
MNFNTNQQKLFDMAKSYDVPTYATLEPLLKIMVAKDIRAVFQKINEDLLVLLSDNELSWLVDDFHSKHAMCLIHSIYTHIKSLRNITHVITKVYPTLHPEFNNITINSGKIVFRQSIRYKFDCFKYVSKSSHLAENIDQQVYGIGW